MYKALAVSDYCDIRYHIPSRLVVTLNVQMEKTERIQYRAALADTGAVHCQSITKLYEEL